MNDGPKSTEQDHMYTICGSNVVLRTVCTLYFNEIQRLSSAYNILPWHTSYIDVKRTFWSFFLIHCCQFSW